MHDPVKRLLLVLVAATALSAAVSTASARRLEVSNTGFRIFFAEARAAERVGVGGLEINCPLTIEGTFHSRTISKVSGQLIGYITSARTTSSQCTFAGEVTRVVVLNGNEGTTTTLPWHMRYDSFRGTLPAITGFTAQIVNIGFEITAFGIACLYKTTAASPAFGIASRNTTTGQITGVNSDTSRRIPRFSGGILCPSSLIFEGSGRWTLLGNTTLIFVQLVS